MKFLRVLLIIIVILVVIIGILTMVAPTKMSAKRSITINAPRAVVYKNVSTFENLHKWGPWDRKDSTMKTSIEGTDGTVGAVWKWDGNKDVGQGEQTFTKIDPENEVDMHLHFIKPMSGQADAIILTADTAGGTNVTWQFNSEMPRPFNIMGLFVNMDKAIGKDFEEGLSNLKELSEKDAASAPSASQYQISELDMPAKVFIGKRETVSIPDMSKFFMDNSTKLGADVQKAKLEMAGPPSGIFYSYDDTATMKTDMAVAFPVKEAKSAPAGWQVINVPAGKALVIDYWGNYKNVGAAYGELGKYAAQKGMKMQWAIEEYITDHMVEKDTAKWETKINYYVQ